MWRMYNPTNPNSLVWQGRPKTRIMQIIYDFAKGVWTGEYARQVRSNLSKKKTSGGRISAISQNITRQIDGGTEVIPSSGAWAPGASNYYKIDVKANISDRMDALVSTLDQMDPVLDLYSCEGTLFSSDNFVVYPALISWLPGTFTPNSGGSPVDVYNVISGAFSDEHRIIMLDRIKAKKMNIANSTDIRVFQANYNFDLTQAAGAYLALAQSNEWTGDTARKLGLYFLTIGASSDKTINFQDFTTIISHSG